MPKPMTPESMSNDSMYMKDMVMHMSFFWGKDVTILFQGWPDNNLGMYILALAFVFFLSAAVEILSVSPIVKMGTSPVVGGLTQASVYAIRMALAYMVMLSVMSFNLGVFIVAVAGHAFGLFVVKYRALATASSPADVPTKPMTPESMSNDSMYMKDMVMHMSFFWGKDVTILFQGWPDNNLGMYILALAFVFFLSAAVEILSVSPIVKMGTSPVVGGLTQASVYAIRMALAYMVMLSVMSFNLGVFIVAVAGHAFGLFVVKYRALATASSPADVPTKV
ncbi:unnamed protein product [Ilex paraguariensis]|uniref:Copper transport protein n=1 Tax=Ilex paraguariensis TaxID=185542 RepID=A0ABC8S3M3_9AQUA